MLVTEPGPAPWRPVNNHMWGTVSCRRWRSQLLLTHHGRPAWFLPAGSGPLFLPSSWRTAPPRPGAHSTAAFLAPQPVRIPRLQLARQAVSGRVSPGQLLYAGSWNGAGRPGPRQPLPALRSLPEPLPTGKPAFTFSPWVLRLVFCILLIVLYV